MHSLGTARASQQAVEVTIPVVVISPTGDLNLAKAADSAPRPPLEPTDMGKVMVKGSSVVIITHGEPAFAQADIASIDMDNHLPGSICHGTLGLARNRQDSDVAQALHACEHKDNQHNVGEHAVAGDVQKPAEACITITELDDTLNGHQPDSPGTDMPSLRRSSKGDCNI